MQSPILLVVILLTVIRGSRHRHHPDRNDPHRMDQHGPHCPQPNSPIQTKRLHYRGPRHWRIPFPHPFPPSHPQRHRPDHRSHDPHDSHRDLHRSFLSFLGLGIQAPAASWGVMVNDGLSAMRYYPWRLFFPAAMITLTMLSFNLLGNALRDALDPRLRR